jgi:hypothetical protein
VAVPRSMVNAVHGRADNRRHQGSNRSKPHRF